MPVHHLAASETPQVSPDSASFDDKPPCNPSEPVLSAACVNAVRRIKDNPQDASIPKCVVCGEPHLFANCPVLNNAAWLRDHHIRFCSFVKRDRMAFDRHACSDGTGRPLPHTDGRAVAPVHKLQRLEHAPAVPAGVHSQPPAQVNHMEVDPAPDGAASMEEFHDVPLAPMTDDVEQPSLFHQGRY